jgi:hypothetical protein
MFVCRKVGPGPQRYGRADDDLERVGHPMPDELCVVEEGALIFLTVTRSFGELGGRHDELLVGEAHQTLRVFSSVVCSGRLIRSSDQVFLCRLHVDVGFCQPKFCGHGALVGRAHPLLNVMSLTGSIGLPHISEELTGIRIHLTRIGFNPTRIRHDLTQIGVHPAFVRGHFASVGIRFSSVGHGCTLVGVRLAGIGPDAARLGGTRALPLTATLLISSIHQPVTPSSM